MINYIVCFTLFVLSLYTIIVSKNLFKKIVALTLLQTSILIFFINMAKIKNSLPPISSCLNYKICPETYSNPLPHVLMLTAIVVGVSILAVAIALTRIIDQAYNTIEIDEINKINYE